MHAVAPHQTQKYQCFLKWSVYTYCEGVFVYPDQPNVYINYLQERTEFIIPTLSDNCTHTCRASTVEPPNIGHVGDNINSAVVSFVERLSSFGDSKRIRTIGKTIFGTLNCVLCREVYYISEGPLYRITHDIPS